MIKVIIDANNRKLLILGLSRENLRRLPNDMPIPIDLQALEQLAGARVQDIAIIGGETEDDMKAQIRAAMGPAWDKAEAEGRIIEVPR